MKRFSRKSRQLKCDDCADAKEVYTTLVADLVRLAAVDAYDVAVLRSGDGDFASALEAARARGKQTYIATWGRG